MHNISDKTNDSILRKFSDEQMDRQTEGQTDRQTAKKDFKGSCKTNTECPNPC